MENFGVDPMIAQIGALMVPCFQNRPKRGGSDLTRNPLIDCHKPPRPLPQPRGLPFANQINKMSKNLNNMAWTVRVLLV
jgi:hypothetical protein